MQPRSSATTNPSIFLRLNAAEAAPREFAWDQFVARYVPIIRAFAQRLGGKPQDVDDVAQDVLMGFFLKSPTFVYDPSKGRFRRYLKVCTYHALQKRFGERSKLLGKPLSNVDPESVAVENVWNDVWEQELLARAIEQIRAEMGQTRTFAAFEQYVVQNRPAEEVARVLEVHVKSVFRAKDQITRLLRARLGTLRGEE